MTGFGQEGGGGCVTLFWPMRCKGKSVGEFWETFSSLMRTDVYDVNIQTYISFLPLYIIVDNVMLGTMAAIL